MNTDFHNSFTVRFRRKFSIDLLWRLPPHLSCVVTLPCEIWKSNIFAFQKQSLPLLIIFSFCPLCSRQTVRIWTPSTTWCGVPTRACVQAPQDHGHRRAVPACQGGMGPSGPGSDWQCDQSVDQATDSLCCSQWRTFWTFTLNITAFVHILVNMFWTLLTLLSVKQINFPVRVIVWRLLWIFGFHKVV